MISVAVMAGLVPAIPLRSAQWRPKRDGAGQAAYDDGKVKAKGEMQCEPKTSR